MIDRLSLLALLVFASPALLSSTAGADSLQLDESFRPPAFTQPWPAGRALALPDGKYLLFRGVDTLSNRLTGAITRFFADGTLDPSFNFTRDYFDVAAVAALPNGQLVVAVQQASYHIPTSVRILRLNEDGSIDQTFTSVLVHKDADIRVIAPQPDGKILVAGIFDMFAGTPRQKIARLLSDGTVDTGFNPPQFDFGSTGIWSRPRVFGDGKILIAGDFMTVNGAANPGIARLNADGSLDMSFQPSGFTRVSGSPIRGVVVQSDNKIVIGARFVVQGTTRRAPLWRLNGDGSTDDTYLHVTLGFAPFASPRTLDLAILDDNVVVGAIGNSVYRFNSDGSLDSTFHSPILRDSTFSGSYGTAFTIERTSAGRFLIGGTFTEVDGEPLFSVAQLLSSGQVADSQATPHQTALETWATSYTRLENGVTLFTTGWPYTPLPLPMPFNIGSLNPDGSFAAGPTLSTTEPASVLARNFLAKDLTELADGTLFIWGLQQDEYGTYYGAAARFLRDGREDTLFRSEVSDVSAAHALPDGKVLLSVDGADAQATVDGLLRRLGYSGALDPGFELERSLVSGAVVRDEGNFLRAVYAGSRVLAVQADGKLLFVCLLSDKLFHLMRINRDGAVDSSFAVTTFAPYDLVRQNGAVFDPEYSQTVVPPDGVWTATPALLDAECQADGGIVLAGRFTSFNGTPARGIVRLHGNGTVDPSFATGTGAQWTETAETASFIPSVEAVEAQLDGKLLLAGTFEAFNGTATPGLARLNSDGSLDPTFVPPAKRMKFRVGIAELKRQNDGSFLLSGGYASPGGSEASFIHLSYSGGVPVIGSPALATVGVGQPFRYQIVASGQPTSFSANGLPAGFSLDPATGIITGFSSTANVGTHTVYLTASNNEGMSAPHSLILTVPVYLTGVSKQANGRVVFEGVGAPNVLLAVQTRIPGLPGAEEFFTFDTVTVGPEGTFSCVVDRGSFGQQFYRFMPL